MTLDELSHIRKQIALLPLKSLTELTFRLIDEFTGELTRSMEREKSTTLFAKEYQQVCTERDALRKERDDLKKALKKTADQNQKKTRTIFGRSTEKTEDLFNAVPVIEEVDEADHETIESDDSENSAGRIVSFDKAKHSRRRNKKKAGKRAEDLSRLRHENRFVVDFDTLDQLYGEGNYRIAFWHKTTTIEHTDPDIYALDTWTPAVSIGLAHELRTVPAPSKLLPGSLLSPSLGAEIIYQKFFLLLPYYRLEAYFAGLTFPLGRQIMSRWVIRIANDYFCLLFDYMKDYMLSTHYTQCDETTLQVIHDGRKAGAKSYVWVHSTSELLDCYPVILFCYELTRGTDHLRKFYKDYNGVVTCDAYCSYHTLESERAGEIEVTGCLMHARRRYVDSLALIDVQSLNEKQVSGLLETRALILLGKIFDLEGELKSLSLEERGRRRDSEVRPLMMQYYELIEGINLADPLYSDPVKDAVSYSINQKVYLCRFLDDGNIPCDNGNSERHIRALATARHSFLFCNTIAGAEALAVMFSIVETAKANGADVRCYLRYILEQMPQHTGDKNLDFLPAMMPWSKEYQEHERQIKIGAPPDHKPNEFPVKPKVPKRKSKAAQSA